MSPRRGPCGAGTARVLGRATVVALAALALALAGCGSSERASRRVLVLGEHHLSVRVPDGWQVLEFGREARMSQGAVTLTLGDLGPAVPEGIQREVDRAHALWKSGHDRDARWVLGRIPVPDELFGTQVQRTAFWADWSEVLQAPDDTDPDRVDEAFERIRADVASLAQPDLGTLAGAIVGKMEPPDRREVAATHPRLVAGRPAVVIRTWDRLTHEHPRRVAIVLDGGYALKVDIEGGTMDLAGPAFEGLLDSLRFEIPSGNVGAVPAGAVKN